MSRTRQTILCAAAVLAAVAAHAQAVEGVSANVSRLATNQVALPPPPVAMSPVNYFRQLLMMSPAERNKSLANRAPTSRARILAKVREYMALDPDERELRLRATELHWYLMPLLRMPLGNVDAQLALVPDDMRELVKSRLAQWDVLPDDLKHEFLANQQTLHYFTQTETASINSNPEAQEIAAKFSNFLELTPAEKQQMLGTLSETERVQMEKTLKTFDALPPQQRVSCIRNYAKFAGMTGTERTEFLKNAENWSRMSPGERQSWRDLVARVPLWPPMPPAMPPLPPMPRQGGSKSPRTSMATN